MSDATRTILVGTDFSAPATAAVNRAAMLAAMNGAGLRLLHVVKRGALDVLHDLLVAENGDAVGEDLVRQEADALAALARAQSADHDIAATSQVTVGSVVREIVDQAERDDAWMVVLGDRGAGFISELVLGTTTERVLSRIRRPLLVVKGAPEAAFGRVLVPVDFSTQSLPSLILAQRVAPEAEIVLMHAFEVPFEGKLRHAGVGDERVGHLRIAAKQHALEQMNRLVIDAGLAEDRVQRVLVHGEPTRAILDAEREQGCDLIVLGRQGKSRLEEWLVGSVARHILGFSSGDLLILP